MDRWVGVRSLLASLVLIGVAGGTGCMLVFDPPEPPTPRLTQSQVQDVHACQEGIHKAGRRFVNRTTRELERCAAEILEIRLAYENDLISEPGYEDALDGARLRCEAKFARITKASTRFVDQVVDACAAAEEWILGWDSLSFQIFEAASDGFVLAEDASIEEFVGSLCVTKTLFAAEMSFWHTPRLLELLSHLGEDYVEVYDDFEGLPVAIPEIPLDERCPLGDIL